MTLCEYLVFRRNFKFCQFHLSKKLGPEGEENKEQEEIPSFPLAIKGFFDGGNKFKLVPIMVEREEYKTKIT